MQITGNRELGALSTLSLRFTLSILIFGTLMRSALGFECLPVEQSGPPVITQGWNQRCIPYSIRRGDPLFNGETLEALVRDSFEVWSSRESCTDLELLFVGYTDQGAGFDSTQPDEQQNVVLSTNDATEADNIFNGDSTILAVTLTTFSPESGEIFDADIVMNLLSSRFEIVDNPLECRRRSLNNQAFDIQNTLVHEIGHFVGFDHVDDVTATMLAQAAPCEVIKRDLASDDIDAVCTTYPAGRPLQTCQPPPTYNLAQGDPAVFRGQCERALDEGCGCRTSSNASIDYAIILGFMGLWFAVRNRRRGQQQTTT